MDRKRKSLNGWQRLWIALTGLIWLGYAVIFAWFDAHKYRAYEYEARRYIAEALATPACQPYSELPFSTLTQPPPSDSNACWFLYNVRSGAQAEFGDQLPFTLETYNRNLAQQKRELFFVSFSVLSLVVAVIAGLAYCAGLVVAWIRRGFSQN